MNISVVKVDEFDSSGTKRSGTMYAMATVTQFWAPHEDQDGLFQAFSTVEWTWQLGDNQFYWGFAVRPQQANMQVEIDRQFTTSDNNLTQVEHFVVTVSGFDRSQDSSGGMLQFTAIKVQEP